VQNRPNNDHGYHSWSLKVALARNMRKMQHICCMYALHISPNSSHFPAYFASEVLHILRKFSAINQHPQLSTHWPDSCLLSSNRWYDER